MEWTPPAQSSAGFFERRAAPFAKNLVTGKDGKRVVYRDALIDDMPAAVLIALTRLLFSLPALLPSIVQKRRIGNACMPFP